MLVSTLNEIMNRAFNKNSKSFMLKFNGSEGITFDEGEAIPAKSAKMAILSKEGLSLARVVSTGEDLFHVEVSYYGQPAQVAFYDLTEEEAESVMEYLFGLQKK